MDAAASWLSEPNDGDQLAYALFGAACTVEVTTEQVYLALITLPDELKDHSEGISFSGRFSWVSVAGQGSRAV